MQTVIGKLTNLTVIAIVAICGPATLSAQGSGQSSKAQSSKSLSENSNTDSIDSGSIQEQVFALLQTQAVAWNQGDLELFMGAYWKSPELTFSSGGKTTRGWQATLDRYKKSYDSPEKMGHLTFDGLEFQLLSSQVALVLGRWHLKRTEDAPEGNFSLVLKKIDGEWKVVHDHSSTLEEPETPEASEQDDPEQDDPDDKQNEPN